MTKCCWVFMVLLACVPACYLWEDAQLCQACRRPLHSETSYQVTLENGDVKKLCCPRCGLHFQTGRDDVAGARTTDYPTGKLIAADQAFYVENSSVMLCCSLDKLQRDRSGGQYGLRWDRCLPSLVSFEKREEAERFLQERGGALKTLAQVRDEPDFSKPLIPMAHP